MTTNDLSNKELIVQNYITQIFSQQFPNLDTSAQGAFMEMFGFPHIKLLTPLMNFADRVKLTQSLDNASLMTEQEMDDYGAGLYMYRNQGSYSVGYGILTFSDIPANGIITVPAGTEGQSKQGYLYSTISTTIFTMDDLAGYYDPTAGLYNLPIMFQAENPGSQYNILENELVGLVVPMDNLVQVSNPTPFTGGVDYETNEAFAARIKSTSMTPNLGVDRGWTRFAKNFPQVRDVTVAGFGHPLMQRDIIGVLNPGTFNQTVDPNVHWGGKVDLHVRGTNLNQYSETMTLTTDANGNLIAYLSQKPVWDVLQITFSSSRYTDPTLDPSFFVVQSYVLMKDENPETMGTLNETAWVLMQDNRLTSQDTITVQYRYNQLIVDMNNSLYTDANRPPGTDILIKESREKFVHGALVVKLQNVTGIQESNKSIIRQRLYSWFDNLPTGGELQFSDTAQPIYSYDSSTVDTVVDYINLPPQFMVTDNDDKYLYYCLNQEKKDFLTQVMSKSAYFQQWIPYYQNTISVYDFFDMMHTLTFQNVDPAAWNAVSNINHDWGRNIWYVNTAKTMLAYVNAFYRLSPAKWDPQENEYFTLGYLAVYEDLTYQVSDIQTLVNTFLATANPGVDPSVYAGENMLHLVVYCCVLLYVSTSDNFGGLNLADFFNWLVNLTKGTPIDYQVNG